MSDPKSGRLVIDPFFLTFENVLWRLSVSDYHAMIDIGVLTKETPVELIDGFLVRRIAKTPRHSGVSRVIYSILVKMIDGNWFVDRHKPLTMSHSEPEPNIMVVAGLPQAYFERHPYPEDVALVIEVADTTLRRDQGMKKRLYASVSIPVYWVVNLPESQIEVYSDPSGATEFPNYRQQQTYVAGQQVPVVVGGVEIGRLSVADLLP